MDSYESQRSIMVKVGIFTATMLLVAFGLVVTFGEFRFGPSGSAVCGTAAHSNSSSRASGGAPRAATRA